MTRNIQVFPLSTRQDPDGGPVRDRILDNPGEARTSLRLSGARHVLILVHGFNNRQKAAEESYSLFYARLEEHFRRGRGTPDAVAYFHWPGNFYRVAPIDAVAWYHLDIPRALDSAKRLAEYLTGFTDPASLRVTLVGHSLGCRLILHMLKELPSGRAPSVDIVSLMAPAVPVELVARIAPPMTEADSLNATVVPPRRLIKFYSSRDLALSVGFPLGQQMAFDRNLDGGPYLEAVGLYGRPDYVGIPFETENRHGDYWKDARTTDALKGALDPTYPTRLAPRRIAGRETPSAPPLESWQLAARK